MPPITNPCVPGPADWFCFAGAVGAYMVAQCDGISDDNKTRIVAMFYAIETLTAKTIPAWELDRLHSGVANAIAGLIPVLPVHVTGKITNEQLGHAVAKQVILYPN
jgi:hypothetical protein